MTIKRNIFAIAVLAAVLTAATASGLMVQASTAACGTSCTSPTNQSAGTGQTLTASFTSISTGATCPSVTAATLQSHPSYCVITVTLAAASATNPAQDWSVLQEGGASAVSTFIAAGALPPKLGAQYSGQSVLEIQAVPSGVPTGLCLAFSSGGTTGLVGSQLTLSQCGSVSTTVSQGVTTISSPAAWILDSSNDVNGYVDLISGTSQTYSLPQVLTVGSDGKTLTLQPLSEIGGVVSPTQMWAFSFGAPTAVAIKAGARHHT